MFTAGNHKEGTNNLASKLGGQESKYGKEVSKSFETNISGENIGDRGKEENEVVEKGKRKEGVIENE